MERWEEGTKKGTERERIKGSKNLTKVENTLGRMERKINKEEWIEGGKRIRKKMNKRKE